MLKKYKVLHDLPFIKKGDTVSEYDDDVVGIRPERTFMWDNKDFYLEELVNGIDIGDLPLDVFNELKETGQQGQFLEFDWCTIYNTVLGSYEAHGSYDKQDVVSDVKYISEMNEDDADLSFYKCYHNKKEVKVDIKHEVVITIQE